MEKKSGDEPSISLTKTNATGVRAKALKKSLDKTIEKCVSAGRFSLFAKNYSSLLEKNPPAFKSIHEQYKTQLLKTIKDEVDLMFEEEDIITLMNDLDKMVAEAPDQPAWRPSGEPSKDLRAHIIPIKLKQKEKLKLYLQELEKEKGQLSRVMNLRQQKLLNTKEIIEEKCDHLTKCAKQEPASEPDR